MEIEINVAPAVAWFVYYYSKDCFTSRLTVVMQKYQLDVAKVGWQDPLEDGEAGPALSLQTLNALPCSTFFVKKEITSLACEQAVLASLARTREQAFRVRKVTGTFEKRAPDLISFPSSNPVGHVVPVTFLQLLKILRKR